MAVPVTPGKPPGPPRYEVIERASAFALTLDVNDARQRGAVLVVGVTVCNDGSPGEWTWAQAVEWPNGEYD